MFSDMILIYSWEYPNLPGIGCNTISPHDSANFLAFLQDLRKDPHGSKMTLSAAVGLTPFASLNGSPMTDVSAFATVLDHISELYFLHVI
jgi:chitinase